MQIWNPVGSLVPCVLNDADLESSEFPSSLCAHAMMQIWNPVSSLVPCVLNDADLESSGFPSSLCAQ